MHVETKGQEPLHWLCHRKPPHMRL